MTVLGEIVLCTVYRGQDEQWQADHVSLIHLRLSAVSTGLLLNLCSSNLGVIFQILVLKAFSCITSKVESYTRTQAFVKQPNRIMF